MSTKIYNGYHLDKFGGDLVDLLEEFKDLQEDMQTAVKEDVKSLVVKESVDSFDRKSLGISDESIGIPKQWIRLMDKGLEIEKTGHRDPEADFSAEVGVFPVTEYNHEGPSLVALFFAEKDYLKSLWRSLPFVEPYPYQDQFRPAREVEEGDMTEEEYSFRYKVWEDALGNPRFYTPAEEGWSFQFSETVAPMYEASNLKATLDDYLPPFKERVKVRAIGRIREEKFRERFEDEDEIHSSDTIRLFRKIREWLETDEGQERLEKEKDEARSQLKEDLTWEDLS